MANEVVTSVQVTVLEVDNGCGEVVEVPVGSLTTMSRAEVFIGTQPAVDYAAVSFTESGTYPGLYIESVNVP